MKPARFVDRFADAKARADLLTIAQDEGLHHRGSGPNRCECPGCRNGDVRGASLSERDGIDLWHCFRDDTHGGSALDFLMHARGISMQDALVELERIVGIDPTAPSKPPPPRRAVPPPRQPPPPGEVLALWNLCKPLGLVPEIAEAWAARSLDVSMIEDRDLARALPRGTPSPRWAFGAGQPWSAGERRLIVPLYDHQGRLASLHARAATAEDGLAKGLSPMDHTVAGLVMADVLGRLLLAGRATATRDLLVAEGVPDFLTWATHWGDAAENAPAIFGIIAGSWTEGLASRVPDGVRVLLATHIDDAGEKYAGWIAHTLRGRCRALRWHPREAA